MEYKYSGEKKSFSYYSAKNNRRSNLDDVIIDKGTVEYDEIIPFDFLYVTSVSNNEVLNCTGRLLSNQGFYFIAYDKNMLNTSLTNLPNTGKYIYKIDANKMYQDGYKFYEFDNGGEYNEKVIMCHTDKIPNNYIDKLLCRTDEEVQWA